MFRISGLTTRLFLTDVSNFKTITECCPQWGLLTGQVCNTQILKLSKLIKITKNTKRAMLSILHDFVGTAGKGTSSNEVTTSQFSRGKSHLRWKSPNLLLDVKRLSFLDRLFFGKPPCHIVRKTKHRNLFSESVVFNSNSPLIFTWRGYTSVENHATSRLFAKLLLQKFWRSIGFW